MRSCAGARFTVSRLTGNAELRGRHAAADALARLLHGPVGQADDDERRHALGDVRLDVDARAVIPVSQSVSARATMHRA